MGIEFEEDAEAAQTEALANVLGPQAVGQLTLVGARLVSMKTSEGTHTMTFDNGITAEITGSFKLRESEPRDLGGGEKKELTGEGIQGHFRELEKG
jgi:hypothetical protein